MESFSVFVEWMVNLTEPPLAEEPDLGVHLLYRLYSNRGIRSLSPDLLSLVRAEALHEDGELHMVVKRTYDDLLRWVIVDLASLRAPDNPNPFVSDELVAYALITAHEGVAMRASWDRKYTEYEVMLTNLLICLVVEAVYRGEIDLGPRLARYKGLLRQLAEAPPPMPPGVEPPEKPEPDYSQ